MDGQFPCVGVHGVQPSSTSLRGEKSDALNSLFLPNNASMCVVSKLCVSYTWLQKLSVFEGDSFTQNAARVVSFTY